MTRFKVTFESVATGEQLAQYENQTSRQRELLVANPPVSLYTTPWRVVIEPTTV